MSVSIQHNFNRKWPFSALKSQNKVIFELFYATIFNHNLALFSKHIEAKENSAHYLQSMRQYLHYHIQSSKTYLHSRIRKKISHASYQIELAKFEADTVKIKRGRKGKGKKIDIKDEDEDGALVLRAKK